MNAQRSLLFGFLLITFWGLASTPPQPENQFERTMYYIKKYPLISAIAEDAAALTAFWLGKQNNLSLPACVGLFFGIKLCSTWHRTKYGPQCFDTLLDTHGDMMDVDIDQPFGLLLQ